jgi:hypothetical protein
MVRKQCDDSNAIDNSALPKLVAGLKVLLVASRNNHIVDLSIALGVEFSAVVGWCKEWRCNARPGGAEY